MSDPAPDSQPLPPDTGGNPPATPPAPAASDPRASGRRGFFANALREVITPVAGLLEKRITPVLSAIENIPAEVERLTAPPPLDQPHVIGGHHAPRNLHLPTAHTPKALPERYLRPPGAMEAGRFEQVCSTCGACVAACPAGAIQLDPNGLAGDGFPYIVARDQPCVVCESLACMKSCPSGALKLVDRAAIRMGVAAVDALMCLRNSGEECTLCLDVCPMGKDFGEQPALIVSTETGRVRVRKNICIGCGLCESRCPTDPAAITILPEKGEYDIIVA
ncbi:MAG TPA: 4Fe-4S dicluster domain-containing protein [Phycisphaerae bacterium]|nr:4Fe-4S dicluster domain-containing protein [Phycisphaerae bacterium]